MPAAQDPPVHSNLLWQPQLTTAEKNLRQGLQIAEAGVSKGWLRYEDRKTPTCVQITNVLSYNCKYKFPNCYNRCIQQMHIQHPN